MSKNDDKIKTLLTEINIKKEELGIKPKANWKTNGILKVYGFDDVNINTINSTERCIAITARLLFEKSNYTEACKLLELPEQESEQISNLNDILNDIKLRSQMVLWDIKKKKLELMEKKLKDLRSEDAKTEEALADIESGLKL